MRRLPLLAFAALVLVESGCNCGKTNVLTESKGILDLHTTAIEFGPVTEFTSKVMPITLENQGKGALGITLKLDATSSTEFVLGDVPPEIEPGTSVDVQVTFSPLGSGDDTGSVQLTSDDADHATATITLHGGPIFPTLGFEPDGGFLAFAPTSMQLTQKYATVRNVGGSSLHVTALGVNANGSPDFSVVPPALPVTLKPGEGTAVEVDYSRSMRATEGLMEALSDDPDAGLRRLRLLPDPAHACEDGIDNDMDGLIDFPNDPGCSSPDDDDEYNPPECVNGAMRPCGSTVGICKMGEQLCASSIWGYCDGGVAPKPETCNGLDDNCSGVSDEGISEVCTIFGCPGARACIPDSGIPDGGYTPCIPVAAKPETCNGIDDNCNGMIDEGIVESCTVNGCGGVRICIPGGDGGFTSCMPSAPHPEVCNGIDDDCNGQIDDGIVPQTCGQGPCLRSVPGCVDGGIPVCTPGTGSTETCNNVDDNCDGLIDNNVTQACYDGTVGTSGVGRCHGGTQTCSAGSFGSSCPGEVVPTTEICNNNIDDNCNGMTDESCSVPDAGCFTNGQWNIDGGAIAYTCALGEVTININAFVFSTTATTTTISPFSSWSVGGNGLSNPLVGPAATCPSGSIDAGVKISGGCTEQYNLRGTFVGPNEWDGVLQLTYTGGAACFGCSSRSFPVQAFR